MKEMTEEQAGERLIQEVFNLREAYPRWDWNALPFKTRWIDQYYYEKGCKIISYKRITLYTLQINGVWNNTCFELRSTSEDSSLGEGVAWELFCEEPNLDEGYFDSAVEAVETAFESIERAAKVWEKLRGSIN